MIAHKKYLPLIASIALATIALLWPSSASALSGNAFKPGRIIDDAIFTNKSSMNIAQIQQFLDSKVSGGSCDTAGTRASTRWNAAAGRYYTHAEWGAQNGNPAPFVCTNIYRENPDTRQNNLGNPGAAIGGSQSSAEIIFYAAQQYNINPQVLLVLLQKEQSLITDDWPWQNQFQYATGAYCPDNGGCDAARSGFASQVREAARLFRAYMNDPWLYFVGNNNILYSPNRSCGTGPVYIENLATAALYHYTPYQPNQAALDNLYGTGDGCSAYGNRNFWRMYTEWFGSTIMPYAFKTEGNPNIYVHVSGYKLTVPAMGILQDYGISPESIQTINQSAFDAVPSPVSGDNVSNYISYIVKSSSDTDEDGGGVYIVSIGKRYRITSMSQLNSFGFNQADIAFLPLGYIKMMPDGGNLSNFVQAPNSAVFKVAATKKQIIPTYQSYIQLNPSDQYSPFSYFLIDKLPSGAPATTSNVLIKPLGSQGLFLYDGTNYFAITKFDTYNCWGFESTLQMPVYQPPSNTYIGPIVPSNTLNCLVLGADSKTYLLSENKKYEVPASYGIASAPSGSSTIPAMLNTLPTASQPLKRFIKSDTSSGVWYLESGYKKIVPSLSNYLLLGIGTGDIDTVRSGAVGTILSSGLKLANGQLVKSDSSPVVYSVYNNTRYQYTSSDDFLAYGNKWEAIETYSQSQLNAGYPIAASPMISKYLFDSTANKTYLVDINGCVALDNAMMTGMGINQTTIAAAQAYTAATFPGLKLNTCRSPGLFVRQPSQNTVWFLEAGTKRLISSWNTLVTKAGTSNPSVLTISPAVLSTIPTGAPLD